MSFWNTEADKLEAGFRANFPAVMRHFLSTATPEQIAACSGVAIDALSENTRNSVLAVLMQRYPPSAAVAEPWPFNAAAGPRIALTQGEIHALALGAGIDCRLHVSAPPDEQETYIVQALSSGHSGPGLYAWAEEYPEEAVFKLADSRRLIASPAAASR